MRTLRLLTCLTVLLQGACGDDDGATNNNTNDNRPPACGNGVVEAGEACDDGAANSDTQPDACRADCRTAYCGDGVIDASELCDDGNALNDGCLTACQGPDDCCVPNTCGDGFVDPTMAGSWPVEACDDGNTDDGDDCRGDCKQDLTACGNGDLDQGEECDDAQSNSDAAPDACRTSCRSAACGDGVQDSGEECDDGNFLNADGCSSGCTRDAALWRAVATTANPSSRSEIAMAYDAARDRTVLFGGWDSSTVFGDTWELDGSAWQTVSTATSPLGRSGHAMTYDGTRMVVVLFGGYDVNNVYRNDLWEYDGGDWVQQSPATAPPTRAMPGMVYDSRRGVHVLFGGYRGSVDLGDTWEYDGVDWSVRSPTLSPPARSGHAMAYDALRERVLLFGGNDSVGNQFGDTWEYDGATWVQRSPSNPPAARGNPSLGYHAGRQRVVLFGGLNEALPTFFSDTWEWDGVSWIENPMASFPPARAEFAMTYDSARLRLVLFGGRYFNTSNVYRHDTWEYYLQSFWPDENCSNGLDDDLDTLVDCDDPDCVGSPGC